MNKAFSGALLSVLVAGCGTTSSELNKIRVGESREEVIVALGKPHAVASDGQLEYLTYWLDRENMGGKQEYFVQIVNGRVKSFGNKGDFGTTVKPTEKKEITVKQEDGSKPLNVAVPAH